MSDHPEIRIGDRERLATQDRLRDAYGQGAIDTDELEERLELALRARTQSDLVPLIADLPAPVDAGPVPQVPAPPTSIDEDDDEDEEGSWWGRLTLALVALIAVVAVFSGALEPPAIFGSRTVTVGPDSDDVRVVALFGSVEVRALPDTTVNERVIAIFGSGNCEDVCGTGSPDVTVTGLALFGSVSITPPEDAQSSGS